MNKKYIAIIATVVGIIIIASFVFFNGGTENDTKNSEIQGLKYESSLSLDYAKEFKVDYYEGGYALITINEGGSFLVVPEDKKIPDNLDKNITVLKQPLDNIYLVATSAMDLFRELDGINNIKLSGTDADSWYIKEAADAIESGEMKYAGKYSAPDYELILENDCDLAIESTMIYHSPEVKEQLESFEIPVLVERSSYEEHPLGRLEWIKLYAVLLDKEQKAQDYFDEQIKKLDELDNTENTGKTVAFFYITSNGTVNVRKSNDYVSKMIEMAGGNYIFDGLQSDNSLSTVNMQMESFYAQAKDADYIIYNSTIDGELKSVDELIKKSDLLKDFKAVKEGNVWCMQKSMFQETTSVSDFIVDINKILTDKDADDSQLKYLYRLK